MPFISGDGAGFPAYLFGGTDIGEPAPTGYINQSAIASGWGIFLSLLIAETLDFLPSSFFLLPPAI